MEVELIMKQLSSVLQAANRREPFVLSLGRFLTDQLLQKYLLPAIQNNLFIFQLNLSSAPLSDAAISKFCSTLQKDSTLRCLKLAHLRGIGSPGFKALASLLSSHSSLRTLDLSDTHLLREGKELIQVFPTSSLDQLILQELLPVGTAEEFLSASERDNLSALLESINASKIRKINLSDNEFNQNTLKVLLQSLPRDTLQKLYLNRVGLQAAHLPYLTSFVTQTLASLKVLHLSGNSLGSVTLGSLFSSTQRAANLVDIDVSEQKPFFLTALVSLNPESLLPLGTTLPRMRRLYLNGLNLGDENGLRLFSSPSRLLNLQILELAQNRLTHLFLEGLMKVMMDYEIEMQAQRSQEEESEFVSSQNQSRVRLPTLSSSPIVGGAIGGLTGSLNSVVEQQAGTEQVQLTRVDTMTEETENQDSEVTDPILDAPQAASLEAQSQGKGLELLDLAGNPLGPAGAQILAEMITFASLCKRLKRLELEKCELGDEGAEALESAVAYRRRHLVKEKGFTRLRVRVEGQRE